MKRHLPRELRKTVTVVFSDVAGSTAIGERLDPEPLRRLMLRWYEEMKAVCEVHGGKVRELIGDAVMAAFGIPTVHEDDALRAVRAAAEMRERLQGLNDELEREFGLRLQSRTGVNTGEVIVRDPDPTGALALGDAVNVAARLQAAAEPGEILVGEATHRLVRDAVRAESVEPLELKGKSEPVATYRLLEVLPHAEGVARHFETPLVGRERELLCSARPSSELVRSEAAIWSRSSGRPGSARRGSRRSSPAPSRARRPCSPVVASPTGRRSPTGPSEMVYGVTGADERAGLASWSAAGRRGRRRAGGGGDRDRGELQRRRGDFLGASQALRGSRARAAARALFRRFAVGRADPARARRVPGRLDP